MSIQSQISSYLQQFNLDIRSTGDARFMDQKVTPDVLSIIADCVINFIGEEHSKEFKVRDIWDSEYFNRNVKAIFNKPDAKNETASSEYDKFINQPLKMLSYAHILTCEKRGTSNYFTVEHYGYLEYISLKPRNAYVFLHVYIIEVLRQSGLLQNFETYKDLARSGRLTRNEFQDLKRNFQEFLWEHTNINRNNIYEARRIFPKILNIYAVENIIPGTVKGRLSQNDFYFTDLMYNRVNWRDIQKHKNITRQEAEQLENEYTELNTNYLAQKAINLVKKLYSDSEVRDQWATGTAEHVHHIFSRTDFPQIAHYIENLIKLTAGQHLSKAHPNGNTQIIDRDYQLVCLVAKSNTIERSISHGDFIYSKESFVHVVNTGLSISLNASNSFQEIRTNLTQIYNRA